MDSIFHHKLTPTHSLAAAGIVLFATVYFAFLRRPSAPFWGDLLPLLGVPSKKKYAGTAVICGGSVSGLLAARVCADHFEKVILVDSEGQAKSRSYQNEHPHAYLTLMIDVLRRLWPSFMIDAEAAGAVVTPADLKITSGGVPIPAPHRKFASGTVPETVLLRRKSLDALLQRLLFSNQANVERYSGVVVGLNSNREQGDLLSSVTLKSAEGGKEMCQDASLVVDCTGALQMGSKWLQEIGYKLPNDLRISYDPKARYFTTVFTVPESLKKQLPIPGGYDDAGCLYGWGVDSSVGNTGFLLTRMDNDAVMLCCFGWGNYKVPKTVEDIIPHIDSVKGVEAVPGWVYDTIRLLIQEGDPVCKGMRLPSCSNVRYHMVQDIPANFVAIGDSCLQLNPAFAQGCSKAAIQVIALNALLKESREGNPNRDRVPNEFSRRFFKYTADYLQPVWDATKAIDYGHQTTVTLPNETHKTGSFIRWYSKQCLLASITDINVAYELFKVQMFSATGSSLVQPKVLFSVLFQYLKRRIF